MLILRFQRQGKRKDFIFRVIAVDSKIAVNSGKSKEILGWWDPRINKFELKKERILYWISQGAQVSDSCFNLLIQAKIIEGKKRPIKIRKKKEKKKKVGTPEKTEQVQPTKEKPAEEEKEKPKEEKQVSAEEKKEEVKEKIEEKKEEAKEQIKEEPKEKKEETKEKAKEKVEEKSNEEKIEK